MEEMNNVIENAVETTEVVENNAGGGFRTLIGIGMIAAVGVATYKGVKKIAAFVRTKLAERKNAKVVECVEYSEVTDSEEESK